MFEMSVLIIADSGIDNGQLNPGFHVDLIGNRRSFLIEGESSFLY